MAVTAFFTLMSVCIIYYDIPILSALKTDAPVFIRTYFRRAYFFRILSALKCGQNADRNYQHKSKKCLTWKYDIYIKLLGVEFSCSKGV